MQNSFERQIVRHQAVKARCEAKSEVWRHSPAFQNAFEDYCACLENLVFLLPANGVFNSVTKVIELELQVADTILTTELDALMEQFRSMDAPFVADYAAARSAGSAEENPAAMLASAT